MGGSGVGHVERNGVRKGLKCAVCFGKSRVLSTANSHHTQGLDQGYNVDHECGRCSACTLYCTVPSWGKSHDWFLPSCCWRASMCFTGCCLHCVQRTSELLFSLACRSPTYSTNLLATMVRTGCRLFREWHLQFQGEGKYVRP